MASPALPLASTVLAGVFAALVLRRFVTRAYPPHLGWWGAGLVLFGVGTGMEALSGWSGWSPGLFRTWYVAGALLGGAPLAQGTVYLLMRRRTAHRIGAALVVYATVAVGVLLAAPLDPSRVDAAALSGNVLAWPWVRLLTIPLNIFAVVFLVGGAALSAVRFRRHTATRDRFLGNVLIAVGALLPAFGGAASRAGAPEYLYATELAGLALIFGGFLLNVRDRPVPVLAGATPG